jgi:hypothetical protein
MIPAAKLQDSDEITKGQPKKDTSKFHQISDIQRNST